MGVCVWGGGGGGFEGWGTGGGGGKLQCKLAINIVKHYLYHPGWGIIEFL